MTDEGWKDSCKVLNNMRYVGKQNQPLLSSHLHENCMVNCYSPGGSVPTICEKRIVDISNSILTQLANIEWIYFVTSSESITIRMEKPPC